MGRRTPVWAIQRQFMLAISLISLVTLLAACGGGSTTQATAVSGTSAPSTGVTLEPASPTAETASVTIPTETVEAATETAAAETETSAVATATSVAATATSVAATETSAAATETAAATSSVGETSTAAAAGSATPTPLVAGKVPIPAGAIQIAVVAGAMQGTMDELARKFEQANPGMKVQVVQEPEGGAFEALIAAGNQPDLITGSFGSMPAKYASMNALVPLEELPGAQELFAKLDERTVHKDLGHNYYVPLGVDITMMIYNKELFTEAGLDPNKPPHTWDEFLQAAEKIQALPARKDGSKVYGNVFWNDALTYGGWYWNALMPIYLNGNQNACQLLNRLGTDIVFDKPECKMADFFDFTQKAQKFAPPTMEKNFFSRSIGMWLQYGYSWEPNLKTAADHPMVIGDDVAVAPVPVPKDGDQAFTTLGGRPLMLMKTTPQRQEAAWKFVQFLMQDDNNLQFIKELGYLPAINSLKSDPYFAEPQRKPFVDMLPNAVYPQALANFDQVANAVLGVYQDAVVQDKYDPQTAVKNAAEKARAALK